MTSCQPPQAMSAEISDAVSDTRALFGFQDNSNNKTTSNNNKTREPWTSARTGQACDRCKVRKIRCDVQPERCSNCLGLNVECYVTDPVSGRTERRGYTQQLEREKSDMANHIIYLQHLLSCSGVPFRSWVGSHLPSTPPPNDDQKLLGASGGGGGDLYGAPPPPPPAPLFFQQQQQTPLNNFGLPGSPAPSSASSLPTAAAAAVTSHPANMTGNNSHGALEAPAARAPASGTHGLNLAYLGSITRAGAF